MATHKNPTNEQHTLSVLAQGVLAYDSFSFDLEADYADGADADESILVIGVVPADCVLVPHLSRLSLPVLDSNGVPTGDYEVGTLDNTDALLASRGAETAAAVTFGKDWLVPTTPIGSKSEDTPIVIRVSNAIATLGTGKIVLDAVFRAWNPLTDG